MYSCVLPTDTPSPIFSEGRGRLYTGYLERIIPSSKVRRIVHSKLKLFHFQINTYYLSDANHQTDNPSHTNPSLVWKRPFLLKWMSPLSWAFAFNFFVNRNWKKLTESRKRAKILADNRKSHHPFETLFFVSRKRLNSFKRRFFAKFPGTNELKWKLSKAWLMLQRCMKRGGETTCFKSKGTGMNFIRTCQISLKKRFQAWC